MITLQIRSLELGYRYLVRELDACEVWTSDHMLIASFPAHLIVSLLMQYLSQADTVAQLQKALEAGEASRVPLFPLASYQTLPPIADRKKPLRSLPIEPTLSTPQRQALRAKRRSRRKA